jgi:Xaa-Pro aminopeptidase
MTDHTESRRAKLRRLMAKTEAEALLVTKFSNVTYLTGFTGDDSYLLVMPDRELLITDGRYTTQLAEECPQLELEVRTPKVPMIEAVTKVIKRTRLTKLAIEADSMTVALKESISENVPPLQIVSTRGLVEQLREIKDGDEVEAIRRAIEHAERAFQVIRASLRPEQTELQVANELEYQIRSFGGAACSFPPIIAVGPRAALPHATPTDRRIGESDFILIDWGAKSPRYMSDLTRVLVTGKISPKLERIYGVVLKAQLAAISAIRPGALMSDVDAAARRVIEKAGFGPKFNHGLGHGIGLEIHESPRMAATEKRPLKTGMVVTVEPGIYFPGWGGVRIEDDVLVTRGGNEVLSHVDKELAGCVVG